MWRLRVLLIRLLVALGFRVRLRVPCRVRYHFNVTVDNGRAKTSVKVTRH